MSCPPTLTPANHIPKPPWLKVQFRMGENFRQLSNIVKGQRLHTVCEEARCPNQHECWERGTATVMILGDVCTRSCGFCAVKTGRPTELDTEEPLRVAEAIQQMGLKHVVITSVNRDELKDGGAAIWAQTILEVRRLNPQCSIEVLTPDFKGALNDVQTVLHAKPNIFSHNLETTPALSKKVRPQAKYDRSLTVLKYSVDSGFITKTGMMLGLGETFDEVINVMHEVRGLGVHIFNLGQYLQPTRAHLPVARYVDPKEFEAYKRIGFDMGFRHIESGPLVRSSYHADEQAVSYGR